MSEIEKMYKTIFGEFAPNCSLCVKFIDCKIFNNTHNCNKFECDYKSLFTAEKQIAILMFILNKFGDIGFQKMYSIRGNDESTRKDFIKCLCDCEHETFDSRPVDFYYQNGASGDNFEESLAGLINNLWQSLTKEEQQQIKEILK